MTVPIISHSRYTYSLHLEMKPEWILKRKKKRLVALLKFIISIPILKNVRNNKIPMCSQPSFYFLTFCYNCIRPLCVGERIFLNETPQIDLKTLTLSVAFLTLSFSYINYKEGLVSWPLILSEESSCLLWKGLRGAFVCRGRGWGRRGQEEEWSPAGLGHVCGWTALLWEHLGVSLWTHRSRFIGAGALGNFQRGRKGRQPLPQVRHCAGPWVGSKVRQKS